MLDPGIQKECAEDSVHMRWIANRVGCHWIYCCVFMNVEIKFTILLSIAHGDFDTACDAYARRLERKRSKLGDEVTMEGTSLNASILLSLEFLQDELRRRKVKTDRSISDLSTRLCVLEHQVWVPISVLRRLWQLDEDAAMDVVHFFSDMSLATLRLGSAARLLSIARQ